MQFSCIEVLFIQWVEQMVFSSQLHSIEAILDVRHDCQLRDFFYHVMQQYILVNLF
jgi:hypothetical protein